MKRSTDRILVTHVGSLVRPPELRALLTRQQQGGTLDQATYAKTLAASVAKVVDDQEIVGVDIPSDGEFGKLGWTAYIVERLGGLEYRALKPGEAPAFNPRTEARDGKRFAEFWEAYKPVQAYDWQTPLKPGEGLKMPVESPIEWQCTGPITYIGQSALKRDMQNFKAAVAGHKFAETFLPVAAPASAKGNRSNRYYKTDEDYLAAVGDALRDEYRAIVDAGFLIQLDDAFMAHEYDRLLATKPDKEVHKYFESYIEMLNHALEGIPEDKVRYHVCWGSWNAPHTSDVPLKQFVDLVLKVHAQAYSLEAANPRHEHEVNLWREVKLPDGKILIPGIVTHSTNVVEHPELVAWRIKNFADLVGRENVIAGTDCGFSQSWHTVRVHPQVQWAKLEALAEGARLASKDLWR